MIINLNGRIVPESEAHLPLDDSAVLFGDSLFETMKVVAAVVEFEREHLDRLELSARLLALPFDRSQVEQALRATVGSLSAPVARLRLTITRGPLPGLALPDRQPGTFFIVALPYLEPNADERQRGNYADCLYAADFARRRGAREALFVDDAGLLLEGATSNIFLLHRDTLITPPAGELVLPGIMRRQVLEAAARLGIAAMEREVHRAELFQAEEVLLSNSLIGLLPVASIEQRPLRRGAVTERLLPAIHAAAGRSSTDTAKSP